MPTIDPFTGDAFGMTSLTIGINRFPNLYGRAAEIFPEEGVATRSIMIEEYAGVLNLLPTKAPGAPGTLGTTGKRKVRTLTIPHIPHDDVVLPEEVQGVRMFGSENALETQANVMARKLKAMSMKHDITREHLRMGALKGIILDADGSTLYNLYTEFAISQEVQNFQLTTGSTEVISKVLALKDYMDDHAQGEFFTGIKVYCSSGFFRSLVTHASVKEAFKYYTQQQKLSGDYRSGFDFGGVIFEQYSGTATDAAGTARPFIAADEAHAFPTGTLSTFKLYNAPADFNETANTLGLPKYAKQEPRQFGRGWDLHTQSNPLPICHRPELLVKLTKS